MLAVSALHIAGQVLNARDILKSRLSQKPYETF